MKPFMVKSWGESFEKIEALLKSNSKRIHSNIKQANIIANKRSNG